MSFWWSIPSNSLLTVGRYRLTFKNVANLSSIPDFFTPASFEVNGKTIQFAKPVKDLSAGTFSEEVALLENPIPVAVVVGAIAVVAVLTAGYLVLDKIEKLVDNPAIDAGIVAVGVGGVFLLARMGKK